MLKYAMQDSYYFAEKIPCLSEMLLVSFNL